MFKKYELRERESPFEASGSLPVDTNERLTQDNTKSRVKRKKNYNRRNLDENYSEEKKEV